MVEIINFLPKNHPKTKAKMIYKFHDDKIIISCVHRGKNNRWKDKILNPQNQPESLTIPSYLKLNEKFGEVIGLYYGDGTKNNMRSIEFSNFCVELIKMWLEFLYTFDISYNDLEYRIKISENSRSKYNVTYPEIIGYWRKQLLQIPKDNIIKINWVKSQGKASDYLRKYGTFVVRYNDSMFSLFFNTLMKNIPTFIKTNSFRKGFVRGLIAAEGNINIRKNESLSLLRIAGSVKERKFISKLLNVYFKIKSSDDNHSNQIYIGNIKQFRKLKKFNFHALHPEKQKRFESGYEILLKNLKRNHDDNAFLNNKLAIEMLVGLSQKSLCYKSILKSFNISREYLRDMINGYKKDKYRYNGLIKLGLVKKVKQGKEFRLFITERGRLFLEDKNL